MTNQRRIAIVGIGLRYPDADSPHQLWDNVLAGRRAFRRIPDERTNLEDYYSSDPDAPDRFYTRKAAVLRDYEFDRVAHKVAGSTFRSTDMTHWLALDVAGEALVDAGFPAGEGLPRERTGVVLGNSLTGEFTRANVMRLRWPYVRRTVAAALTHRGWDTEQTAAFLTDLERQYKDPFPGIDEDTLAGGLANTIAGRICNVFDLAGGGFTVDGACSSSLLSVVTSANALVNGDLDVAIAGGVDLSIDPFEVIGFAKTGALATGEMKVYDQGSNGFWPGEGCGIVVLEREEDALARGVRIYASIPGWGVSSDGKGGITRPEATGHRQALARAYTRAGYGVETVSYFEGHGTGTALGDETEIEALSSARSEADPDRAPAALGTIKGNIGHTKAAAGVAGLIKAALAVHHRVIPPATGHLDPHPALGGESPMYVPLAAEAWPAGEPRRAGVSAMGFGGINSHIAVCEAPGAGADGRTALDDRTIEVVAGRQDVELLLLDGADTTELAGRVAQLRALAPRLSFAELADVAATLAGGLRRGALRAAVVARSPEQADERLARLEGLLAAGSGTPATVVDDGVFLGSGAAPRIGYLFPGQGSGRGGTAALARRFPTVDELQQTAGPPAGDQVATEVAQPRIVVGSLAALRVLRELGVEAGVAAGHSLGELTALHWSGALREDALIELARTRGKVMGAAGDEGGAMAGLTTGPDESQRLIADDPVVVAGLNAPAQTVIAGPAEAVGRVCERAATVGISANPLAVSHAFHSPAMASAAREMASRLADVEMVAPELAVISTVTGAEIARDTDLRALLGEQIEAPVRFHEAAGQVAARCDLMIEVGPGRVLTGLAWAIAPEVPTVAVDADDPSLAGMFGALGAAYVLGAPVDTAALFAGRLVRELPLDAELSFLANPCESAPALGEGLNVSAGPEDDGAAGVAVDEGTSTLDLLRRRAAERVELPLEAVTAETHPLDDLHLSSITVGQLVNDVTHALGRPPVEGTPNFATARLGEIAQMVDDMAEAGSGEPLGEVAGTGPWVRPFAVEQVPAPPPLAVEWSGVAESRWTVHASDGHPLAEPLRDALASSGAGDGVLLCLPTETGGEHAGLMLAAAQDAAASREGTRFVAVQHGLGVAGLARTLRLEDPSTRVTLIDLPDPDAADPETVRRSVATVVAETVMTHDVVEACYDAEGGRTVPRLRVLQRTSEAPPAPVLDVDDVLLVTGGGKGITAESALALARHTGAALALMGRSDPAEDEELAGNLERIRVAGVRVSYARADVADAGAVARAVATLTTGLGPVTAVLHGAGRNEPAPIRELTEASFRATLAPKVDGLRAVLAAVDPDRIRLLVTFGSIIGRAGLAGEGHYATANDWMTELTRRFGAEHPQARVAALEWSVWSGVGMGEKLGVVAALERDGITPIPTTTGIEILLRLLDEPGTPRTVLVTGRTGGLPTLPSERVELPLARFVDQVLVHYPGIELITEAELSAGNDPYLADHELDGDLLFPAVIGMEAMVQVASAVSGRIETPTLADVEFLRPVVVTGSGSTTIRVASLVRDDGAVDVAIRSADTGYAADHFRSRVEFGAPAPADEDPDVAALALPAVALDPAEDLYGNILFQGRRFQRLGLYRRALARDVVADVEVRAETWFAPFLPQERWLADPGARDTVMHALQACIPDGVLLPEGVERLHLAARSTDAEDTLVLHAHERGQHGDSYTYDIDVRHRDGTLAERWEGLTLRAVRRTGGEGPWPSPLLASLAERGLEDVLGGSRAVAVEPDGAEEDDVEGRRARTARAVERALGAPVPLDHRPDGKPELPEHPDPDVAVSASHAAGLTVAVVGRGTETVDVEPAVARSEDAWAALLGDGLGALADLVAQETGEAADIARTRVWTAVECVGKTGQTVDTLTLERPAEQGWVVFANGDARIATWVTTVHGRDEPLVLAELSEATKRQEDAQ